MTTMKRRRVTAGELEKRSLNVEEAAQYLAKAPETIYRWISAGKIKAVHEGGRVIIFKKALALVGERICEQCGRPFTPKRPTRRGRYCSKACAWNAAYKRRKAAAVQGPGPAGAIPSAPVNERLKAALNHVRQERRRAGQDQEAGRVSRGR